MSLERITDCTRAMVICVISHNVLFVDHRHVGTGYMFASCTLHGLFLSDGVVVLDCLMMLSTTPWDSSACLLMGLPRSSPKTSDCSAEFLELDPKPWFCGLLPSSLDVLRNIFCDLGPV